MNQSGESTSLTNGPETWGAESDAQRRGTTGLDQIKSTIADKLRSAAGALHEKTAQAGDQSQGVSQYGRQAADWLDRSADYVQEFNPQQLKSNVEEQVRRNPGRSLLIAGAAGLVLGALLRRR